MAWTATIRLLTAARRKGAAGTIGPIEPDRINAGYAASVADRGVLVVSGIPDTVSIETFRQFMYDQKCAVVFGEVDEAIRNQIEANPGRRAAIGFSALLPRVQSSGLGRRLGDDDFTELGLQRAKLR